MKLNCRPGDLAVVVGAPYTPEMIGMIVLCDRLAIDGEVVDGSKLRKASPNAPSWVVHAVGNSIPMRTWCGKLLHKKSRVVGDRYLRPIRDNDQDDETLTWAGLPAGKVNNKETA